MSIATILVEDSETIRDTLIPAMKELVDADVIAVAVTAAEGIAALVSHPRWQLVVIDMFLKEGTGLEVLRAAQTRSPLTRAVVLSNYPTDEMRRRCSQLGADAFFDKSAELEAFFDYCAAVRGADRSGAYIN